MLSMEEKAVVEKDDMMGIASFNELLSRCYG